ncbi:transposase [Nonomuraea sp. NPDC049129]|uniref:transposase n=2 Tax=unclassified Nonomuraea TaxID=2593643 RepID=UPI0033F4D36D
MAARVSSRPANEDRFRASIRRALALGWLTAFRRRLYEALTSRADALFELIDAIVCADQPVTSLVQLSLEPEFRRGHGALYDALAAGNINADALTDLLVEFLPVAGPPRRPRPGRDEIAVEERADQDSELLALADALAVLPADQARATTEACLPRGIRPRFAIDGTPYPRPDAECSPDRGHVYHDACRCDGTRKTIPGWEYQFVAALGELRSAWTAPVDVARTTHSTRLAVTTDQVRALIGRLEATGQAGGGLPIPVIVLDAGYPATALTAALTGVRAHLVLRLPAKNVYYRDPLTWPGKVGRPGKFGQRIKCVDEPQPEPDEELLLPGTTRYGTVRIACWRGIHPKVHGGRTYFADWQGDLPIIKGNLIRVQVERLPDGRTPHQTLWLWHAGPTVLALSEIWRAYLARFDEEHTFKFSKGTLGLITAKLRTPEQTDRWVRLIMAALTQLAFARDLAEDLRRPWEKPPTPDRPLTPGRVRRGFRNIHHLLGTPAAVPKHTRAGPGRPRGSRSGPAPHHPVPRKQDQPASAA